MTHYLTKRQQLLLPVWLILVAYGVDFELSAFYTIEAPAASYLMILVAILILLVYSVPALVGVFRLTERLGLDRRVLLMALVTGLFVTGWLASFGNSFIGSFWELVLPEETYLAWEAALTAPIIEEVLKTGFAYFVLYFANHWEKKLVFFTGLLTGLGFQIIEDVAYVVMEGSLNVDTTIATALSRLSGLLSSHYLYSSLITLGLYLLVVGAKDIPKWKYGLWGFAPIVVHFLWNSPLNSSAWLSALLTGLSLWVFSDALGYVLDWPSPVSAKRPSQTN